MTQATALQWPIKVRKQMWLAIVSAAETRGGNNTLVLVFG